MKDTTFKKKKFNLFCVHWVLIVAWGISVTALKLLVATRGI